MLNSGEQDFAYLLTLYTMLITGLALLAFGLHALLFRFKTKHPIKGKK
jgi:tellurite resistance protein TehA-like permease